jgi:guanylate kinase
VSSAARLTVLSGPSGAGKGSVVAALRRRHRDVWVSRSVTTRPPRPGETDGAEYHFVDDETFGRMVDAGELLEYDAHFGAYYGTPRAPVEHRLAAGHCCLLEIDLAGARQVRAALPSARLVFLVAPSWIELELRLRGRGTEDDDRLASRLHRARAELAAEAEFDHVVVNDDVDAAADRLVSLMKA